MSAPTPPQVLQEQLLVVLAHHEREGSLVGAALPHELFDGHYAEVARRIIDHRAAHNAPPGKGIWSLFSDLMGTEAWPSYQRTLAAVAENAERVAPAHVLAQVSQFRRRQGMKQFVIGAMQDLQADGSDECMDRIEAGLRELASDRADLFSPGITYRESSEVWREEGEERTDLVRTGINELDRRGLGPRRGQLHLLVAPAKTGKSFWGVQLATSAAVMGRMQVAHVTLEISAENIWQRIHANLFNIRRTHEAPEVQLLKADARGRMTGLGGRVGVPAAITLADYRGRDAALRGEIDERISRRNLPIVVKSFPAGRLTVAELEAYLDGLAGDLNFRPDLLIIDYADLMHVRADNLRLELDRLFVDLRGLAQERNLALATMTQSNRQGADSRTRTVRTTHVAESWGKIAAADTVLTLTRDRAHASLARLSVAASRVGEDGLEIALAQDYSRAQFAVSQALVTKEGRTALDESIGED